MKLEVLEDGAAGRWGSSPGWFTSRPRGSVYAAGARGEGVAGLVVVMAVVAVASTGEVAVERVACARTCVGVVLAGLWCERWKVEVSW